jgi:Xaa-Pro aminopeptidase
MNFTEDGYKLLHDVQKKCNELNQKIDSMIRIMEMLTAYMQYSNMMSNMSDFSDMPSMQEQWDDTDNPEAFSPSPMPEGSETMNPNDFQKIMNAAKNSNQQMSQDEFNQIFETLKQGKSPEEVARMEQMVQLAKSFMK